MRIVVCNQPKLVSPFSIASIISDANVIQKTNDLFPDFYFYLFIFFMHVKINVKKIFWSYVVFEDSYFGHPTQKVRNLHFKFTLSP